MGKGASARVQEECARRTGGRWDGPEALFAVGTPWANPLSGALRRRIPSGIHTGQRMIEVRLGAPRSHSDGEHSPACTPLHSLTLACGLLNALITCAQ